MDDSDELFDKVTSQYSEFSAVPNTEATLPGFTGQWTQFSGISPQTQTSQIPFRNICTWNPMDLPDFGPLSQNLEAKPDCNVKFSADVGAFGGCSDFLPHGQLDSHTVNSPHEKLQVAQDLSGRLIDVSQNSVNSHNFDKNSSHFKQFNLQSPKPVYHYDSMGLGSDVPLRQHMSQMPNHRLYADLSRSNGSALPNKSSLSFDSNIYVCESEHHNAQLTSNPSFKGSTHLTSVRNLSNENLHQTSTVFESKTQPSFFPYEKHRSDNYQQLSSHFPEIPSVDFMNSQHLLNYNTAAEKMDLAYLSSENDVLSVAEEQTMFDEDSIKKHWLDLNNILSSDEISEPAIPVNCAKPSYSEVAKTPKTGPSHVNKADQTNVESVARNFYMKTTKKEDKPLHPSVKRTLSGSRYWPKSSQVGEVDQPQVAPTSRYGLDSFSDPLLEPGSYISSPENAAKVTSNRRRNENIMKNNLGFLNDHSPQGVSVKQFSESCLFDQLQDASSSDHKQPVSNSNNNNKPQLSSKASKSSQPSSSESLFFDPRRIFQSKSTDRLQTHEQNITSSKAKGASTTCNSHFGNGLSGDTVLNNGKPAISTPTGRLSGSARQHDYINNDLRDSSKLTNQTTAGYSQGSTASHVQEQLKQQESRKKSHGQSSQVHHHSKRSTSCSEQISEHMYPDGLNSQQQKQLKFWSDVGREKLVEWWSQASYILHRCGNISITLLLNLLIVILYIATGVIHLIVLLIAKSWTLLKSKLSAYSGTKEGTPWASPDHLRRRVGLEENISLPATGEEAMKRLLACKGKDPYSILGLRADSADEDIKKYYRKQAVLVHPDKNQQLGAEDAFKILGHAFEMIGEPTKRREYDSHTLVAQEEEAMKEFAEMLSKLHTKMQEAANIMLCDNCKGKHRRVRVDRTVYSARFCQRCNRMHSAKEGDVWAESAVLGFYWHYYALMDGQVFDITDWMKCHKDEFSHMIANSHVVMYRIENRLTPDGNRRNKHHPQGEPDLEDFINRFFKSSANATPDGPDSRWAQGGNGSASAKKTRRKKKRH